MKILSSAVTIEMSYDELHILRYALECVDRGAISDILEGNELDTLTCLTEQIQSHLDQTVIHQED